MKMCTKNGTIGQYELPKRTNNKNKNWMKNFNDVDYHAQLRINDVFKKICIR